MNHMTRPFLVAAIFFGVMMLGGGIVYGQNYPSKPIRIVGSASGSGSDLVARIIAQGLTGIFGQQVIIDNRAGTGGINAAEIVTKAPPDGYTLLYYSSNLWLLPLLQDNVPYDPVKDFAPITLTFRSPNLLVVHPSLPVRSVKDLIALAKARPGALNYGSGPTGSSNHLAAELFKAMANVNIVRIPYKGIAAVFTDLLGGQVQIVFSTAVSATPHVKSGRLRALAVTTAVPSALAPGLPTMAASGLPGYESAQMYGVFAPAGTPAALIRRLNEEIVRVLNNPDVKEQLFNIGVEVVASSPEQFAAAIKSDIARMGKVIKEARIKAD
jgi:tripartite-type tricarboxylate transporter receptor subunit TctC